jgi:hypothetical protein
MSVGSEKCACVEIQILHTRVKACYRVCIVALAHTYVCPRDAYSCMP